MKELQKLKLYIKDFLRTTWGSSVEFGKPSPPRAETFASWEYCPYQFLYTIVTSMHNSFLRNVGFIPNRTA
jgi:hypothetical protein